MISQTAEYALRAIVYLAGQKGQPRTTAQIAEVTRVPSGYLAKVMQSLGRSGLVRSRRGLNGGFTLIDDPRELSVLKIVDAVDPIRRYPGCPLGLVEHRRQLCPLHRRLDQAAAAVEQAFAETRVAELLNVPRRRRRTFCRFPAT
jgi:Rrf2 family protein